jgi:hypothetical protein
MKKDAAMKKTSLSSISTFQLVKGCVLAIIFLIAALAAFMLLREDTGLSTTAQQWVYPIGMAGLLAALITLFLGIATQDPNKPEAARKAWFYPLMAGLLGLVCMSLAYAYLGMWPVGVETGLIVDMHHQYAPLLADLRDMLLHGGSPLYSFHVGLGSSYLPLFAYYLASPFNLLLVLFPEHLLPEALLVITLLKNALTAALFAACLQYVYRRRDMSVCIVAIMYSMMMYLLAYSWNIMWLDCVMILPLVVLGFERMMRTGKFLTYVLSLAYALYANYYIGFMICLFMVLYYAVYFLRKRREAGRQAKSFLRFVVGSALGGGLAMFLLIPVAMALGQTSAAGGTLPDIKANFDIFNLLGRHLYETSPTIRSGNLPNLYCGLLSVVLLPVFATTRSIPLRRRAAYLGLLAVMALSLVVNQMDLIWHGLHAPNDLPYRFSFLYCFVLLLIAFETLTRLKDISLKQVGGTFVGLLAYLMIEDRFGDEAYGFTSIYVSLLLVAVYVGILAFVSRRHLRVKTAVALLLVVVTAEMTFQAGDTFKTLNGNEYYTDHIDYVDNDITAAGRAAVDKMKRYGDAQSDGAFYRMEKLPRRTTVDPALYHYRGLSVFASSNSYKTTKFMGSLGYAINGVNSYLYHSFVAPVDSLFGIKYLALNINLSSHPQLKKIDSVQIGSSSFYIYENTMALPVGYFVKAGIRDWSADAWNPFTSQSGLLSAMTGNYADLYEFQAIEVDEGSMDMASVGGIYNFSVNPVGDTASADFTAPVTKKGQGFIYVDCRAAKDISVSVRNKDTGETRDSWTVTPHEPYIIDAGTLGTDYEVCVTVGAESAATGNIYVAIMDDAVLQQDMQTLSAGGMQVSSFSDSRIDGKLTAPEDGAVFTSIPYDAGWTVTVDGVKVDTYGVGETDVEDERAGAMLAFDVAQGEHDIVLSFFPRGLIPGALISLISLALLVFLVLYTRRKERLTVPALPEEPIMEESVQGTTSQISVEDPALEAHVPLDPQQREEQPPAEPPSNNPPESPPIA